MRSVGCGPTQSRWSLGTGGKTLPQLESYKVPVGVAGPFWVRPAAWTKSGKKPRPDPRVVARHPQGPGVSQVARSVVPGFFLRLEEQP